MQIDTVIESLRIACVDNLIPYIERAELGHELHDPASAFFDFIVEAVRQIKDHFDDNDVLSILETTFSEFDHDIACKFNMPHHLDVCLEDVSETPRLTVELWDGEVMLSEKLMHVAVDMPLIRMILNKRSRY